MLAEQDRQLIGKIADLSNKLLIETMRLQADIVRLQGRIEPFENEVVVKVQVPELETPKTLKDAFHMISLARQHIVNCEHDLGAIRGWMDEIRSDAISRNEMKPWLK